MGIKKLFFFLLIFSCQSPFVFSQNLNFSFNKKIDSLVELNELSLANIETDTFLEYTREHEVSKLGDPFYRKAIVYKKFGNYDLSLVYLDSAFIEYSAHNEAHDVALCLLLKGKLYNRNENYIDALKFFRKALATFKENEDTLNIAMTQINLGNLYKNLNNFEESAIYYRKSLEAFKILGLSEKISSCYNNLGNLYKRTKQYDSTKYYYRKALAIRQVGENDLSMAFLHHNFSDLFLRMNAFDSAFFYINKALEYHSKLQNSPSINESYFVKGKIHYELENYEASIENFKYGLRDSSFLFKNLILFGHLKLAQAYGKVGKYVESVHHFNTYLWINDSIQKRKESSTLESQFIQYEIIKDSLSKSELILQKELSEIEGHNLELKSKITQNKANYLIVGLLLTLLFSILLFISFRKRLKLSNSHKKQLEDQNEELKRTLISKEEKETLLKEVHHRVKNNLQIINSLIRLQSHYTSPTNYKMRLADTENRIRSMSLVHEKLYKSDDLSKLDSESYIIELAENLRSAYEFNEGVSLQFEIANIKLSIDTLIPLGLIINETLSNSIKYAFEGLDSGCISVVLEEKDQIVLTVSDNGVGTKLSYEELSENSLGMELIQSLCAQLDGEFYLDTRNGFSYTFTFDKLD